jgi:quercetin dioxygenase-like cupin family protein
MAGEADVLSSYGAHGEEVEALWFFGELQTVLASGEQTGGRFSVVEHVGREGLSPPWHRQPGDDETFYVLEGEIAFWVGNPDEPRHRTRAGMLVFVPRGTPHSFRIESATARWLTISTPAGHERFYRAGGEPAEARTLPPPGEPDIAKVEAAGRAYGVELLGPPPGAGD